ncbi:uncharacterized protein LOC135470248 [Liolophura sinensis]|uniref:uncharacterized protein LOC135470248 n=1 Tax=Liolophura sinensis TaxID=3198878 RepID=UPI0031583CBD
MAEQSTGSDGRKFSTSTDYTQYGITDIPKTTVHTAWGRSRTFAGLHFKDWLFISVSLVNILAAIGLTIYRLVVVVKENSDSPDFTFTVLLLINAAFCTFYMLHGVLRERAYELYVFIIAILVVLVYCIIEYAFLNVEGRTTVKLVRMIAACILAPPNIYLAWSVARDFGYLEFKIVGASEVLQNMYKRASIFFCLMKFDLQVTSSFVLLALKEGTSLDILEQVSLGVGIPYTFLWGLLGWFMMEREIKALAWVFMVTGLVKPSYYIFKIVKVYMDLSTNKDLSSTIIYSLLAAGALCLLVWIILMLELPVVYRNFGKGLKEKAFAKKVNESTGLLSNKI